ncbi:toll/interleukin-1 receptor domain-containing protein [Microcoleus sp. ZQ-A2]|nr:toll/interleukin-1 receptor domain-containing protein [Microcoleus sp. FACHB-1]
MNQIRPTLIFISIALIIIGFFVSLLTNYASSKVPIFIQENPWLVWILIAIGLASLSLLTVWYYLIENRGATSRANSSTGSQQTSQATSMLTTPNYDVFISYSHKDSAWVQGTLLAKLESHGFKVCIDFRDFPGGSTSIRNMEKAVLESKRVILVLTKNYLKSEWGEFENIMARTIDPAAIKRKVIPLLKQDCDIPLYLNILTRRDLRIDTQDEWDRLIRDLM